MGTFISFVVKDSYRVWAKRSSCCRKLHVFIWCKRAVVISSLGVVNCLSWVFYCYVTSIFLAGALMVILLMVESKFLVCTHLILPFLLFILIFGDRWIDRRAQLQNTVFSTWVVDWQGCNRDIIYLLWEKLVQSLAFLFSLELWLCYVKVLLLVYTWTRRTMFAYGG